MVLAAIAFYDGVSKAQMGNTHIGGDLHALCFSLTDQSNPGSTGELVKVATDTGMLHKL